MYDLLLKGGKVIDPRRTCAGRWMSRFRTRRSPVAANIPASEARRVIHIPAKR